VSNEVVQIDFVLVMNLMCGFISWHTENVFIDHKLAYNWGW